MTTTVCINTCGLKVDGDGKLALNLGTAPTDLDNTLGEKVFCDGDGVLRVPDYASADEVRETDPESSDSNYTAVTPGTFRVLNDQTANYTNNTARTQKILVMASALAPRIRIGDGNEAVIFSAITSATDVTAPAPVAGNYVPIARLADGGFLAATQFLDTQFPSDVKIRVINLAPTHTLSVRLRVAYETPTFSADTNNYVYSAGVDLHLIPIAS